MIKFTLTLILALCATQTSASFASDLVADHNAYRTPLNLSPLTWSDSLAQSAQTWANHLADIGKLVHSGSDNGENLAYVTGSYTGDTNLVSGGDSSAPAASSGNDNSNSGTNNNDNNGNTLSGNSVDNSGNPVQSTAQPSNTGNTGQEAQPQQALPSEPPAQLPQQEPEGNDASNGNQIPNADNPQSHWTSTHSHKTNDVDRYSFTNGVNNNNNNNDGGNSDGRNLFSNGRHLSQEDSDTQLSRLVGLWGAEKQYFVYGSFPDVSNTGDWTAVGHYTQLIWGETKQVGCGVANGNGNIFLVCQYHPAGNWDGETPY